MEKVIPPEPQSASDYDDRTTAAVKSVLIEVGQILGAFKGKFAVIGGAVPWLLLNNEDMPHVGTLDVDRGLDAEAPGLVARRRDDRARPGAGDDHRRSAQLRPSAQLDRGVERVDVEVGDHAARRQHDHRILPCRPDASAAVV